MKTHHWIVILIGSLCFFALVIGVYFVPSKQALVKANDLDATALQLSIMANQISSMNFLLTFIGIAGAIAGLAFTIFGYYQSTKIPEMIEVSLQNKLNDLNMRVEQLTNRITNMEKISKSPFHSSMTESELFVERAEEEYDKAIRKLLVEDNKLNRDKIIEKYKENVVKITNDYLQSLQDCFPYEDPVGFQQTYTLKQLNKYKKRFDF